MDVNELNDCGNNFFDSLLNIYTLNSYLFVVMFIFDPIEHTWVGQSLDNINVFFNDELKFKKLFEFFFINADMLFVLSVYRILFLTLLN